MRVGVWAVVAFFVALRTAHAGDGRLSWFTIESEHFVVSYHEPLGEVAKRVAEVAERAHQTLAPALGHVPKDKTLIVIEDFTDGANGFATVLPRNSIRLFASAPTSKSALSDHDDWLYALTLHEYAHVLHLDNIGGLPHLVNRVVGKIWAPSQIQPGWIIEGLATYEESKHSSGGRTRGSLFDMELRMATLSSNERTLDEMTNGPRAWPHGNTAYMYGSHFLKYVFDRFGDDTPKEMSTYFGAQPVPYGINRSIQQTTGHTFVELYDDWKEYRRDRYALQAEAVERAGRREGRRLTFTGEVNINPRYTPDGGKILWQRGTGYEEGGYAIMPAKSSLGDVRYYARIRRGGEFDVLADGSLVVEQTDVHRATYTSQELFIWSPKTNSMQRLTTRQRLRDPAVSPDEKWVAFVVNGESRRRLAMMALKPNAPVRILWTGKGRYDQALDPTWSPDGKKVAFSAWRQGGDRDILVVDVQSGRIEEITKDRAQDVDPVFGPKGRYLYFSSDQTGIFNVFAVDLRTKERWQVTNVLGGAFSPDVSADGERMVYHGSVADGTELYELRLDPNAWTPAALYVNARPDPVVVKDHDYPTSVPRPYEPLQTLAPNTYRVQGDAAAKRLTLEVDGSDIVGHHAYGLALSSEWTRGRTDLGLSYNYSRLWAGLGASFARTIGTRGGLLIDGVNTAFLEEHVGASGRVSLPVLRSPDASVTLSFNYNFDYYRSLRDLVGEPDPNDFLPYVPETDMVLAGVSARLSYGNTLGYAYTLGVQEGQALSLSMRLDHPVLASDFTSLGVDYRAETYHRLWFGQTPVLALRLAGGVRFSNRRSTPRFSLGGVPEQNIVQSILDDIRSGSTGFLRGYPLGSIRGTQMHLFNAEYRQELWNVERGLQTLPVFLRRIHLAALLDVGNAFDGAFDPRMLKSSVGGTLRFDVLLGYVLPGSFDFGYARGLNDDGTNEWWILMTGTL